MLGKDLYKVDVNGELSNERLKSLIFFYAPLIGDDATILYQYLLLRGSTYSFTELNELLAHLNKSIDTFEENCNNLNRYRLLKTLRQDNRYVFVVNAPLSIKEFIKDDIFAREFIMKTSGEYYRVLTADVFADNNYHDYEDISDTLSLDDLKLWTKEDETYLKKDNNKNNAFKFNTLFDVNYFLKDISSLMFPMKYRTIDNLKQIATLADLYGISYEKMRGYVANAVNKSDDSFNLNQLKYSCMNAKTNYEKVAEDKYNVPCQIYLMSLQDGKEVTDYDKKILFNLADRYYLNNSVINVLLAHTLKVCDNRLLENYIYPIASDFHRNDIDTAQKALERLSLDNHRNTKVDSLPVYDASGNKKLSDKELDELLSLRGKK